MALQKVLANFLNNENQKWYIIHFDSSFKIERWYLRSLSCFPDVFLCVRHQLQKQMAVIKPCELSGYQQKLHCLVVTSALLSLIQHAINTHCRRRRSTRSTMALTSDLNNHTALD